MFITQYELYGLLNDGSLNYLACFSTCLEGRWACKRLQTPATCAVEEGSHVTTFDGKTYMFHGDCHYVLAKVESKVNELRFATTKRQQIYELYKCALFVYVSGCCKSKVCSPGPAGAMCKPGV